MIKWVKTHQLAGSSSHKATIVFDGKDEFYGSFSDSDIKVLFSSGESADDLIKRIVEQNPKNTVIVVSDDKDIKLYSRALGASVLSVREFTASIDKKTRGVKGQNSKASDKYISLTQQDKINQEFQKIWIKSKQ